jgi:hypothetical protein
MPVGPIEVIRAQEATQIRHMDAQRAQHAQEQISKNFHNLVEHEQKKPVETTKAENDEYRYDAREKGNGQYTGSGSKKKQNEDKKESKESKNTPKNGGIDILI